NVTDPATGKSSNYLYPAGQDPFKDRQPFQKPDWRWGMYEIIAYDVKAPSCAGRYFFKVFYTKTLLFDLYEQYESIPPENYPQLVVKGEVDPGYITGRIRYQGHSSYYYGYYYGSGIHAAGKVWANGTALDPVTNQPTGRTVCGVGYFNATAEGYYEIEGLAPGIYTLTACAAGFVPRTLATQVTIKRGQSMHGVDIYLQPSPKLNLTVYSKCPTGPVDWPHYTTLGRPGTPLGEVGKQLATLYPPNPQPLKGYPHAYYFIEVTDLKGTRLAWVDDFFDITVNRRTFTAFLGNPACYSGIETEWDGHVPDANAHFTCGIIPGDYLVNSWVFGYWPRPGSVKVSFPSGEFSGGLVYQEMDIWKSGIINVTVHFHNQELPSDDAAPTVNSPFIVEAVDDFDKVQAWNITNAGGSGGQTRNQAMSLLLLGYGPEPMKRKLPPHGMPEGTYSIKAYYLGYVQQEFPQHTVQYCTNGSLSFHLVKGANITATVYSRDCQDPSQPVDWVHPPSPLRVYVFDANGQWVAGGYYDQTNQVAGSNKVVFSNLIGHKPGVADYFRGENRPTGLLTNIYTLRAYTLGYCQGHVPEVWAQKGSSTGDIPLYLLTGAEIDVILDFKTELIPAPLPSDVHSYQFRIHAYDQDGKLVAANITGVPVDTEYTVSQYPWPGLLNPAQPGGVKSWVFQLFGFGEFTSPENRLVTNGPGATSASAVDGGGLWYKKNFPDLYRKRFGYYSPFSKYPGLPKDRFSGDYRDYGIPPGTYTIVAEAWYPDYPGRYIQLSTVTSTVSCKGRSTVVFELDLLGRISGSVYTRNWMGDFRSGSWLTNTMAGANNTWVADTPVDGEYEEWVRPDTYTVTMSLQPPGGEAGYRSQTRTAVTTWGGETSGQDFYLEESGIPIPEFPATGMFAAISAIASAIILLRRSVCVTRAPLKNSRAADG
ncbi:MAG: carboxypeptidase-like regulatory domain-containing protein, partial [Candidatus Bathyarchaeia archaeon]